MQIRPFTEVDRPFLRTLFLAARRASWHWLDGSDWLLEDFDKVVLGETVLVAERDGRRVGFAAMLDNDNFLHSLYVDPACQQQGIGRALLHAVQARFTSTGALKCMLKNHDAQAFYLNQGWKMVAQGDSDLGKYVLMHFPLKGHAASRRED